MHPKMSTSPKRKNNKTLHKKRHDQAFNPKLPATNKKFSTISSD